jgi:hypothetical protein
MTCIANLIKEYENTLNQNSEENYFENKKLCRSKEVTKIYPVLTTYILDKAVREDKLPVVKIGNFNHFYLSDIEEFINANRQNNSKKNKSKIVNKLISEKFV